MFGHITEMLPIGGVLPALHFLLTGALATVLVIVLAVAPAFVVADLCRGSSRRPAGTGLVACALRRLSRGGGCDRVADRAHAGTGRATQDWHQIGQSFTRLATIMLFIQVPYLGQLPDLTGSAKAAAAIEFPACRVADAIKLLAPHPGAVVLADVNDTPEILYKTEVRTVGSLYHRNVDAFLRLRAAWRAAPSETVPPEIDAAEVSLVLGCENARALARWWTMSKPRRCSTRCGPEIHRHGCGKSMRTRCPDRRFTKSSVRLGGDKQDGRNQRSIGNCFVSIGAP